MGLRTLDPRLGQSHCSLIFPHSSNRAKMAVKSSKRMLQDSVSRSGSIDKFMKAVLRYRNTPHQQDYRRSPAQIVFGRTLISVAYPTLHRLCAGAQGDDDNQL